MKEDQIGHNVSQHVGNSRGHQWWRGVSIRSHLRDAEPGEYRDLDTVQNDAEDYGSRKFTCQYREWQRRHRDPPAGQYCNNENVRYGTKYKPCRRAESPHAAAGSEGVDCGLAAKDNGDHTESSQRFYSEPQLELTERQDQHAERQETQAQYDGRTSNLPYIPGIRHCRWSYSIRRQ